jgi:four helix bundle protein
MDNRLLPHHKLLAFGVAMELLAAVRGARIRDAGLREQAMRAAKSACLNAAEGAGRVSKADKARVFAIARAEAGEAAAAVEIAVAAGDAASESLEAVLVHADKFVAMMTGLIR